VPVSSCRAAEATKLLENIFRCVNIALVNEMKIIYHELGIDIWEVIEAAKTKPFGFMPFYPGPGLGGHCIPIDPFYLSWKAKQHGLEARFIELAGEVNTAMPDYVIGRCEESLQRHGKKLKGSRVLILGLAYKPNVDDDRESPSFVLMEKLETLGATVNYHDPHIPIIRPSREHNQFAGRESQDPSAEYDLFLLATHHDTYSAADLRGHGVPVVDTRHIQSEESADWKFA
jgi:UDP-N-acetyl-D-glucosamine dehydrogenase